MKITVPDIRAISIIFGLIIIAIVCFIYNHDLAAQILAVIIMVLSGMFLSKMYHREIKKDYFSRYDKISGLDIDDNKNKDDNETENTPENEESNE